MTVTLTATAILLVFYLYALAKWDVVKRPLFLLIGGGGLLMAILAGFFGAWAGMKWANILMAILNTIGTIIAFAGAFIAVYGAKLPTDAGEHAEKKGAAKK